MTAAAAGTWRAGRVRGRRWMLPVATLLVLAAAAVTGPASGAVRSPAIRPAVTVPTWTQVPSPSPGDGAPYGELNGVSCTGASNCWAAGDAAGPTGTDKVALFEHWNGSAWTAQPLTGGPDNVASINAVSCQSSSSCWAVGYSAVLSPAASYSTLIEWSDGGDFAPSADPPAIAASPTPVSLTSVACDTATDCWAVGSATEQWNGTHWAAVDLPVTYDAVACPAANDCWAVGSHGAGHWNGTSWTATDLPNGASLDAISCPLVSECWAVGNQVDRFTGASWVEVAAALGEANSLPAVSCATPTSCWAAGNFFSGVTSMYFLFHFDGTSWTEAQTTPGYLGAISCPVPSTCVGVGSDNPFTGTDTLIMSGVIPDTLNKPVVGMAATPDDHGYWLVASDGGIFSYGDATFYGSTGALVLNKPVVGMAATPDEHGYWFVASDGGLFAFGDATFYGSTGNLQLDRPVVAMQASGPGGYWLAGGDGAVFAYGDAPYEGSLYG